MFSALVDVFFVPMLEVDYRAVSDLLEEGVIPSLTATHEIGLVLIVETYKENATLRRSGCIATAFNGVVFRNKLIFFRQSYDRGGGVTGYERK
jgi:hypothetical protein